MDIDELERALDQATMTGVSHVSIRTDVFAEIVVKLKARERLVKDSAGETR